LLVWAAVGRDKKTLNGFFELLGEERSEQVSLVSADGAGWIATVVAERAPNATIAASTAVTHVRGFQPMAPVANSRSRPRGPGEKPIPVSAGVLI
jgi:hypothetical protein